MRHSDNEMTGMELTLQIKTQHGKIEQATNIEVKKKDEECILQNY